MKKATPRSCCILPLPPWLCIMPSKTKDVALESWVTQTGTDIGHQLDSLQDKTCKDHLPPEERSALRYFRQCSNRICHGCVQKRRLLVHLHHRSPPTIGRVHILLEASHKHNISILNRGETICGSMWRMVLIDKKWKHRSPPSSTGS